MRKLIVSVLLFVILLHQHVAATLTPGVQIQPFTGVGPNTTNIFSYQAPNLVTSSVTIGQDPVLGLTFIVGYRGNVGSVLLVLSNQGQTVTTYSYATYTTSNLAPYANAIYDQNLKMLVFLQTIGKNYWLYGWDYGADQQAFNISLTTNQGALLSYSWLSDTENGVFYSISSSSAQVSSWNTTTGAFIATNTPPERVANTLRMAKNTISVSSLYPVYSDQDSFNILSVITLQEQCSVSNLTIENVFSDYNNYYIVAQTESYSFNLVAYDSQCNPLWRLPLFDGLFPSFTYDKSGSIYLYYIKWILKVNTLDAANVGNYKNVTLKNSEYMIGIDANEQLQVASAANSKRTGKSQLTIVSYDTTDDFDENLSFSVELPSLPLIYPPISMTENGILFSMDYGSNSSIIAIQSADAFVWEFASIISLIIIILSLIFAVALMIKHKLAGEDPPGWNKKKIPDLLVGIITILGIIAITLLNAYTQTTLDSSIQTNTEPFRLNLGEFASNYLSPCSNGIVYPNATMDMDLCTCSDPNNQYRSSSCSNSFCSNAISGGCGPFLAQACDCHDSIYIWSCSCAFEVDSTCSANVTSTSQYNSIPNETWEGCRTSFSVPSVILSISFYYSIVASGILVVLFLLQIILKFDFPLLDIILTICSLFFGFSQFFLLLLGKYFVSTPTCVESLFSVLPACSPNVLGSQIPGMEITAAAYLDNAYNNLLSAPLIFLISALPDLWSLFICLKSGGSEHRRAIKKLCNRDYAIDDEFVSINSSEQENKGTSLVFVLSCLCGFIFTILGICCVFCVPNNKKTFIIGWAIGVASYFVLATCFVGYYAV